MSKGISDVFLFLKSFLQMLSRKARRKVGPLEEQTYKGSLISKLTHKSVNLS